MSHLDRNLEYLLWFEDQQCRWLATAILREGNLIVHADYGAVVSLDFESG